MPTEKKTPTKSRLHPRNKNREAYDLEALVTAVPELEAFVVPNKMGQPSVAFSDPKAVKLLNKALLQHYYGIGYWEFPDANLCPPIPGRADYLHYLSDLLQERQHGKDVPHQHVRCLDVGTGASCIYPLLGVAEYGWDFIASDVAAKSLASAKQIVENNAQLHGKIDLRLQPNPKQIFTGILHPEEKVTLTLCNPPFHTSAAAAQKGSLRKVRNLSGKKVTKAALNFAGVSNELIYKGGEQAFIQQMIVDSIKFANNCYWFTTLVSKQESLKGIYQQLKKAKVNEFKTIEMGTGNKVSRIVAWTFLTPKQRMNWKL
ncbi:23S rRNA (adenine1618-N6)-methyltransferase [Pustulibacterium marinum]|uniref:Ribosomal RNA large subunit methyltransferase F n=1 Tax=Pustulibacterium marinum TaxID=1224947 RepID=A0A1I7FV39_9FLAO|nr:23S rRNA (adenine(1618)-N(6))-methyltransferase RlmF [Pustulibacterium marinum]SFU40037.1 23S rRNA (adenine1618-N6)-methyltransferase [Pustulibacterium marinum]